MLHFTAHIQNYLLQKVEISSTFCNKICIMLLVLLAQGKLVLQQVV